MDARTRLAYAEGADAWISARAPQRLALRRLKELVDALPPGSRVADLGCGPGWYAQALQKRGFRTIALDASAAMLARARQAVSQVVRADLAALPLARGTLDAAFAINAYQHVPAADLPAALAHLHDALAPGAPIALTLSNLDAHESTASERRRGLASCRFPDDAFGARLFVAVDAQRAGRWMEDAGFEDVRIDVPRGKGPRFWLWIRARRATTLPDYVRPGLELLFCGLNPSLTAAETGIPFGHRGNRFWPAALRARLIARERDPFDALAHGVGFTDLAKRATRGAGELRLEEYRQGLARVERSVGELRPRVTCFVGLDGWRRVVDRGARPGALIEGFGGRPAYLMPSTSGLNTHVDVAALARHLRRAHRLGRARC